MHLAGNGREHISHPGILGKRYTFKTRLILQYLNFGLFNRIYQVGGGNVKHEECKTL